ncbi:twitchin-like isoform X2, partial [Paramuricea clavata]
MANRVYENGSLLIDNPYCAEQVPHENFTCVASSFLGVDTQSHAFSIGALMTFPFEIILVNASQFGNRAGVVAKFESVFKDGTDSLSLRSMNVTFVNVTSGMVRFVLTWLEQRLKQKNYIVTINTKDHVNTAQLARDVRNKLKENEVDVAYFFIDAKPGPATDLSVKNVAKKEITFSWTKPDYFTVDYYQIQTNDGGGSNWDNRAQAPGDKTSFVLKGLVSGTKYLIRMESVNNKGTGIPSEHVQAKTDDDDSVSVVIIVVVVILVVLVLIAVVLGVLYYRHKPTRDDLVVITMDDNN